MSVSRRLLAVSLLTLAVGLGALLVVGNVLLRTGVRNQAASALHERAQAQLAALLVTPNGVRVRDAPNDGELDRTAWVIDRGHVLERPAGVPAALDRAAISLAALGHAAETDGPGDVRLRAEPIASARGAVVVGYPMAPLERVQHEVLLGSILLAVFVLVAGGLATRAALHGALRPVAQMTADAEDWSAHDLDRRFGLGPPRDELTGLAATLDGLLARIAASRRHEQRFAAEVAHELRTPLAALRSHAELGLEADDQRDAALRAVLDDSKRLDHAIDVLLAIARRELDPSSGSVDLAAIAAEIHDVEVIVHRDVPAAEGEPDVVRRALAPLVDNARRHARERVVLELSAGDGLVRLAVHDDGPGLDAELAEHVFEPGHRGNGDSGDGAGLGLPLARRLARSCGGDVKARPGNGGCFVLELPAVGAAPVR